MLSKKWGGAQTVKVPHKETGEKLFLAAMIIDRIMGDKIVEGWEIAERESRIGTN